MYCNIYDAGIDALACARKSSTTTSTWLELLAAAARGVYNVLLTRPLCAEGNVPGWMRTNNLSV